PLKGPHGTGRPPRLTPGTAFYRHGSLVSQTRLAVEARTLARLRLPRTMLLSACNVASTRSKTPQTAQGPCSQCNLCPTSNPNNSISQPWAQQSTPHRCLCRSSRATVLAISCRTTCDWPTNLGLSPAKKNANSHSSLPAPDTSCFSIPPRLV